MIFVIFVRVLEILNCNNFYLPIILFGFAAIRNPVTSLLAIHHRTIREEEVLTLSPLVTGDGLDGFAATSDRATEKP